MGSKPTKKQTVVLEAVGLKLLTFHFQIALKHQRVNLWSRLEVQKAWQYLARNSCQPVTPHSVCRRWNRMVYSATAALQECSHSSVGSIT